MIVFCNDEVRRFAAFISEKDVPPVELYVIPGYDALEVTDSEHDETVAFGAYDPENKRIIVPEGITDEDKERVLSTIAHEYFHHIENCKGVEHDENRAEAYAADMVTSFKEVVEMVDDKKIPTAVVYEYDGYADGEPVYDVAHCPTCNREFEDGWDSWESNYCPNCGQRLKWEG